VGYYFINGFEAVCSCMAQSGNFATGYVERVIQPGEMVKYSSTVHWIVYVPCALFLIVGVIGLAFVVKSGADPLALSLTLPLLLTGAACVAGLLSFIHAWSKRWTTELAVTDRRIICKRGFIRRHTIEMNMDKVESVDVDQSFWGRVLNYGTIIVHGTGGGLQPLRRIGSPIEFRNGVTAH
jgi:uncharacterized membrane protein YdbT with pleckstrin-like domain